MNKFTKKGFTLIELLIVIAIIAMLATGAAYKILAGKQKAQFDNTKMQVQSLLQEARTLSMSSMVVAETVTELEPSKYYLLDIATDQITLSAYGINDSVKQIKTFELPDQHSINPAMQIYYFSPSGELCFNSSDCSDKTDKKLTLESADDAFTANFTVSGHGGYAEQE